MEVSLMDILNARDARAQRQRELLDRFGKPLICFTMNIAGPEKVNPLILEGFALGRELLDAQLAGLPILLEEYRTAPTGCELMLVVDADAEKLKAITTEIEDAFPVGRLFDMDVLAPDGTKLSRGEIGQPERRCLLCDKPAYQCSRSRAHSVAQLREETTRILTDALREKKAKTIAALAQKALLYEVCVTPKPGLVDRRNSGSHRDMDIFTFMSSTAALGPYFETCARIGFSEPDPEAAFEKLRFHGRMADLAMLRATGGVNTHKGAIFTLGLLCCAAAAKGPGTDAILNRCADMTKGIVDRDFAGITAETAQTNGQKLYAKYGITGIRGEAEAGFPTVANAGLPALEKTLADGCSEDEAGCAALLAILAAADDTNLIARSSRETQLQVRQIVSRLIQEDPRPSETVLTDLDSQFIRDNLSPGGSADLLSATWFLHFLKEI